MVNGTYPSGLVKSLPMPYVLIIDIWPDNWAASLRVTAGRTFRLLSPNIDQTGRTALSRDVQTCICQ